MVTVSQEGGYDPAAGCVMLVQNNPLLKPEQEVLFVTRHDERHRRHQITSSGYGDVRVRNRTHRDALVRRFERAEEDQVDPTREPDSRGSEDRRAARAGGSPDGAGPR